jgi:hypothetical protein
MLLKGYEVDRSEIPNYMGSDYSPYIELYYNYKNFGFPYSGAWGEQPAHVFDIIKTLLIEESKWQMTR